MQDQLDSCLLLVNRLPPKNVGENVPLLASLLHNEDDAEEFASCVDVPFTRLKQNSSFLCSQYNILHIPEAGSDAIYRRGSGSNDLFDSDGNPVEETSESNVMPDWLLKLELDIHTAMKAYLELYYPSIEEDASSRELSCTSTHLWTLDDSGNWAGCVGFQNCKTQCKI